MVQKEFELMIFIAFRKYPSWSSVLLESSQEVTFERIN